MLHFPRPDGRKPEEMRSLRFEPGFAPNADGSVLVSLGSTRVICAATYERKIPKWMQQQNIEGGWVTAEYSLLPYSTTEGRKARELNKGHPEGRTVEIQRLVGRALRSVIDLRKMPGHTLWLDCDVLQADGGTRVAAISGLYLAAQWAFLKAIKQGVLRENPLKEAVAAVSVGLCSGEKMLDLSYLEDKNAQVDFNVVMTGSGHFVELQGGGEGATFSQEQFQSLLQLAQKGIQEVLLAQKSALAAYSGSVLEGAGGGIKNKY